MSALPSSRKTHSEKHKLILKQLLREAPNKTCVDCKTATHPRWASWNLGCFICIRCSGIHRSMGTHISRVKSVDLDAWTDEQVESMVRWGNAKCNAYWEAKLPEGYVPDALKIENFIRTKYDMRKWAASGEPDPLRVLVGSGTSPLALAPTVTESHAAHQTLSVAQTLAPTKNHVSGHAHNRTHTKSQAHAKPHPQTQAARTANISQGASRTQSTQTHADASLLLDDFGLFTSSPLPSPAPEPRAGRQDLKKSILSLYSSPQLSTSHVARPQANHQQKGFQQPIFQSSQTNLHTQPSISQTSFSQSSLLSPSNSVSSLNFPGSFSQSQPVILSSSQSKTPTPSGVSNVADSLAGLNIGNNEWSDAKWTGTYSQTPLDDDLFKNVWS